MTKPHGAEGGVALVTGAQQGIGAASAISLAEAGFRIVVNYLDDPGAADAVCQTIVDSGGVAEKAAGDISKSEDIGRLIDAAGAMGELRVLVNNAGIFPRVAFLEMTDTEWDCVLDTNLRGTFLCTQAAAKMMVANAKGGAIVNLSSAAAHSAVSSVATAAGGPLRVEQGGTDWIHSQRRGGAGASQHPGERGGPRSDRYGSAALRDE